PEKRDRASDGHEAGREPPRPQRQRAAQRQPNDSRQGGRNSRESVETRLPFQAHGITRPSHGGPHSCPEPHEHTSPRSPSFEASDERADGHRSGGHRQHPSTSPPI